MDDDNHYTCRYTEQTESPNVLFIIIVLYNAHHRQGYRISGTCSLTTYPGRYAAIGTGLLFKELMRDLIA